MLPRFPRPTASLTRRVPPSPGIAPRRRTAAGAVVLVALAGSLVDAAVGTPANAATRRTIRAVTRKAPATTVPRSTSTLVPSTVQVTPFGSPTDTAPVTTVLLSLGGPSATTAGRNDPPGLVPLGSTSAAPALAPEPSAPSPPSAAAPTTTKKASRTKASKVRSTTTTAVPFVPLTDPGTGSSGAGVRIVPLAAGGTAPTTASSATSPGALTISPVLGTSGGQSRTLAAVVPTTTTLVGAGDAATTTTKPVTYVFAQPTEPPPPVHPMVGAVIDAARALLGLPYIWAGEGPDGYDCSGLTMIAWRVAGIGLIHNSGAQFNQTARVSLADLQPGDLVFFGNPIHHEGLYIGDGKMIEAAKQGVPIRISSINRSDLVGAGRPRW